MKIGLIVDNLTLRRWQAEALLKLADDTRFIVYNCTNAPTAPRKLRHAPYYALNLLSLRSPLTAQAPLPGRLQITGRTDFECEAEGLWQILPRSLLDRIAADAPDLIVKFGMGLLRVPPELRTPILSYHHGDPREFRGRPAGFHEMLAGRGAVGQVVQILSDRLDAGDVVAFAETRAHPHSWRRTMAEAYRASPLLLPTAIRNVLAGTRLPIVPAGKLFTLPSAATVVRFALACLGQAVRRIIYGAFYEKAWEVAEARFAAGDLPADFPAPCEWRSVALPNGYRFLADPFPHPGGGLLVEALSASTGHGEIMHIGDQGHGILLSGGGHYSYPAAITVAGHIHLVPEVSEWSPPLLFRFHDQQLEPLGELKVPGRPRLIDPTLFERDGTFFLFANDAAEGDGVLRLWVADSIDGDFAEHPLSPIRMSPAGARMGGSILDRDGTLSRVGQDFRGQYGDGIVLFRIEELSRTDYRERIAGELRFPDRSGPHTVNLGPGTIVFDHYRDRFSPLAWRRRLRRIAQSIG